MLSVEPDGRSPQPGIAATRRTLVLALPAVICFVPVAFGMDLLLGRIPIEPGHAVLATLAAVCVALPRFAETRVFTTPAMLGHRELIIGVTALVAGARAYQAGETVLAMVAFAVILPIVMVIRRIRLGAVSPRRLGRRTWALQAANLWVFLALLAAAALPGTLYVWRAYAPDAAAFIVAAFWVGLAVAAVLVAFPRRRISLTTNLLAVLGSVFLVVQLVGTVSGATGRGHDRCSAHRPVGGHLRGEERTRQQPLDAHRPARRHRHRQGRRREDLPRRPQPPGELPHLRAAAARRG